AENLRDTGQERELEGEKPDCPAHEHWWLCVVAPTLPPRQRCVENRKKPSFEQQRIPLELEEQLAGHSQRQIEQPEQRGRRCRDDSGDEEQRRGRAEPTQSGKPRVARREPHERWPVVVGGGTVPLVNLGEEISDGQEAVFANQPRDLYTE